MMPCCELLHFCKFNIFQLFYNLYIFDHVFCAVCKQPDGSLHRAAILSSAKSKERREIREQKMKQDTEAVPLDLSKNWSDPSAPLHDLVFAQQLRNMGQPNALATQSAWKRSQQRHVNASLGMSRAIPLSEQRKNLPIYALKGSLLAAVAEHDLLVVIGETGSGKTTQMTQYLCEAGYASLGVIGCTQPRRGMLYRVHTLSVTLSLVAMVTWSGRVP